MGGRPPGHLTRTTPESMNMQARGASPIASPPRARPHECARGCRAQRWIANANRVAWGSRSSKLAKKTYTPWGLRLRRRPSGAWCLHTRIKSIKVIQLMNASKSSGSFACCASEQARPRRHLLTKSASLHEFANLSFALKSIFFSKQSFKEGFESVASFCVCGSNFTVTIDRGLRILQ